MNILFLNWKDLKNEAVGGAEIITYELAKRLAADGHKITWFCRQAKNSPAGDERDGIKIIRRGNSLTTYLHAFLYYRSLPEKPELVVDMVNTLAWQSPLYVKGKKLVYVNQLAKEVFFYESVFPISWFAYLLESLQYVTYRKCPFAVYSKSSKEDLINIGIPAENIKVFSLGLDHERYQPAEKSVEPLFIYVGRLNRMKRVDLCIRAMRPVADRYPQAKLAIIGHGYYRFSLEKLIERLRLKENVYFLERDVLYFAKNPGDQKVFAMQRAWALLLPSVKEGWGMVVTEANACATPAIVSDVTGLRDSVIAGKTGLVVSRNPQPGELARMMNQIIASRQKNDGWWDGLSIEAVRWAGNFSWERSYREFKAIIDGL